MRQRDEGCEERGGKSVDTFNRVEKKRTTKDHRGTISPLFCQENTHKNSSWSELLHWINQ